jgi:Circularly permutated YpsA SLOG family
MLRKVISGGQTGVDRAALDVAVQLGIDHGGWLPKGRLAEDGNVPPRYRLREMPTEAYAARTEKNVLESDGTLLISRGSPTGGTDYTRRMALKHGKHLLHIDLALGQRPADAGSLIASWLELNRIETLNVAGPRASHDPSIYMDTVNILAQAFNRRR